MADRSKPQIGAIQARLEQVPNLEAPMERPAQRIIKFAMIGDGIGPVSAEELLTAPTVRWELWRRMITDAHQAKPRRDIAHCLRCGSPVYIRTKALKGEKRPLFAHFAGADAACPWFTGKTLDPDLARAAQYRGQQESEVHRQLCNLIAELASADPRALEVKVDAYRPPTANDFGRYPDVLVRWDGLPDMAIELQLSRTFQTEVSARCTHYGREGMPLLWVLYGVDLDATEIPQSFRDVMSRHRMNAFQLDAEAVAASKAEGTLVLSCRLARPNGGFEPPRLVRLDALTFPAFGLPYLEDRLTPVLMKPVDALRRPWFSALNARDLELEGPYLDMRQAGWDSAFSSLSRSAPALADWLRYEPSARTTFAGLVAIAFSIVTYARGQFRNYATAQDNIAAMLNSRLSSGAIGPYAYLLRAIIRLSAAAPILEGSVAKHIHRAIDKHDGNLCLEHEPEWEAMAALLPELFDPRLRGELLAIGAMPDWAAPVDPDDNGEWVYAR